MQGQWGDRLVFRPKSLALKSCGLAIGSVFRSFALGPGPVPSVIAASTIVAGKFSRFRANRKEESGFQLRRCRADLTRRFDHLFDRL
jgi:hypothetical protein